MLWPSHGYGFFPGTLALFFQSNEFNLFQRTQSSGIMQRLNLSLLDYVPMGAFVIDTSYNIVHWNKCLETWTGIQASEILGQDARKRFPQLGQDKISSRLEGIFLGGPPSIFSAQLHRYIIPAPLPGGRMRLQNTMVNALAHDDKFLAMFTLQDVSEINRRMEQYVAMRNQALAEVEERRKAEQEIKKREALYRSIFEKNKAVKLIVDPETGTIVDANTAACYYYGYPYSKLVCMSIMDINILPEEEVMHSMRMAVEECCNMFEFRHRKADGSIHYVEVHSAPIEIGGHNLLYSIIHDITARKRALEALRRSEKTFHDLFELAGDILVVQDLEGNILDANQLASETLGYSKQELLSMNLRDFRSEESNTARKERRQQIRSKGVAAYESIIRRKDGSLLPVEVKARSIEIDGGPAVLSIARDISARKAMETLREDVERITRHDLKNPLGAVLGLTDILLEEGDFTEDQRQILETVQNAGYSMLNVINLSLDLYKMEQGTYRFKPQTVDLRHVLDKIFQEMREMLHAKDAKVQLRTSDGVEAPEFILVQGEEPLCYSMLFNLLKNAVEASPQHARITVSIAPHGDMLRLEISNPGSIDPTIRGSFFDKYSTHGKSSGTGLGTYSARLFARVQQGRMGFDTSDSENRTTVWVDLPRK